MTKTDYKTLEGIQKHPAFLDLTSNQQKWLLEYLRTGDRIGATHTAYPATAKPTTTTHNYAEERATQNMALPAIRILIAAYSGVAVPPTPMRKQELIAVISTKLREAELTNEQFCRLSQYLVMLNGWHLKQRLTDTASVGMKGAKRKLVEGVQEANAEVDTAMNVDDLVLQVEQIMKQKGDAE